MRKIMILLMATVVLCMSSCHSIVSESTTDQTTEQTVEQTLPPKVNDYVYHNPTPVLDKKENGFVKDYYIDHAVSMEIEDALAAYASTEEATEVFLAKYLLASDVQVLPIYGEYLEHTSLIACCFYEGDTLCGVTMMIVDDQAEELSLRELSSVCDLSDTVFTDEFVAEVLSRCKTDYPTFRVCGIVFIANGYETFCPIGYKGDHPYLGFYSMGLYYDFTVTGDIIDADEGRQRFEEYWIFKHDLMTTIPIYEWTKGYPQHWWSYFIQSVMYQIEESLTYRTYESASNWVVHVPLLDEQGKEGVYVLVLLYDHLSLIGEVVLDDESIPVKSRLAPKDAATGEYIAFSNIEFVDTVNDLFQRTENYENVKGIGFDGEEYFLIFK